MVPDQDRSISMAETESRGVAWDLKDLYASGADPRIDADLSEMDRRAEAVGGNWRDA
jgi:hypothetical protein